MCNSGVHSIDQRPPFGRIDRTRATDKQHRGPVDPTVEHSDPSTLYSASALSSSSRGFVHSTGADDLTALPRSHAGVTRGRVCSTYWLVFICR